MIIVTLHSYMQDTPPHADAHRHAAATMSFLPHNRHRDMTPSEFLRKLTSRYLLLHLLAMATAVTIAVMALGYGLDIYTHHGESIEIPDLQKKSFDEAQGLLHDLGLKAVVSDTGYVANLKPDCVLEQTPAAGDKVKTGHVVYLIVNATHTPTITVPDIIDNSSLREAMAKLSAMGFKLTQPRFVEGEKDWVVGLTVDGRHVNAGDKVSVNDFITIEAGNGQVEYSDDIDIIDASPLEDGIIIEEGGGADDFQEVTEPPAGGDALE